MISIVRYVYISQLNTCDQRRSLSFPTQTMLDHRIIKGLRHLWSCQISGVGALICSLWVWRLLLKCVIVPIAADGPIGMSAPLIPLVFVTWLQTRDQSSSNHPPEHFSDNIIIMSCIRAILVLSIIFIISLEQVEARPRAHIVGNHIMKHSRNVDKKITSNKINKRWRSPSKRMRKQNRNLIKSLLAFEEELYDELEQYEYEEDYESPIIEIRFKRDTAEQQQIFPSVNSPLINKLVQSEEEH